MSKQTVALYNMLSEKQYADVITKGERLLKTNPEDAGIHLAIMDAHFKLRDESESHLVACLIVRAWLSSTVITRGMLTTACSKR